MNRLASAIAIAAAALIVTACGDTEAHSPSTEDFTVVEEGAASGVTSTLGAPGETSMAPMTDTSVDTTTALEFIPSDTTGTTQDDSLAASLQLDGEPREPRRGSSDWSSDDRPVTRRSSEPASRPTQVSRPDPQPAPPTSTTTTSTTSAPPPASTTTSTPPPATTEPSRTKPVQPAPTTTAEPVKPSPKKPAAEPKPAPKEQEDPPEDDEPSAADDGAGENATSHDDDASDRGRAHR